MSDNFNYLPTDIYLFGVEYPTVDGKDSSEYIDVNSVSNITTIDALKNTRLMPRLPIAINLGEDDAALWVSDDLGRLHVLGSSTQKNQKTNMHQPLEIRSPVHKLTQNAYKLSFPEWSMLTELAIGAQGAALPIKKVCVDLVSLLSKLKGYSGEHTLNSLEKKIEYKVTTLKRSQLAPKYREGSLPLTHEQIRYNKWYDSIPENEDIRGFIVPTFSFLAVAFSTEEYADAVVKVRRFDEKNGKHLSLQDEKVITQALLNKTTGSQRPIALFPLASEDFIDGMYTIEVIFDQDLTGDIPVFAANATNVVKQYSKLGTLIKVSYELREYIALSQTTPFGKIAVITGDMISLEESLIYQFPTQFKALQAYRMGEVDSLDNSGSIASMSAALWEVGSKVGASIVNAGINIHQNPSTKHDVIGSLANTFWGQVDKGVLPPAMISALEFSFGVSATAAAYQTLQDLRTAATSSQRAQQIGLKALLSAKVFDREKFFATVIEPIGNGNTGVVAGRATRTWLTGDGSAKSFLSPFVGAGLNSINTVYEIKSLVDKSDQLKFAKEHAKTRKDYFKQVSQDYLNWIPVWQEHLKNGEEILEPIVNALGSNIEFTENIPDNVSEDSAMFIQDHKGAGLRLVFPFDNEEVQATHLSYLSAVNKELTKIPNVVVEVEGHACQNGNSEYNQKLSAQRAFNVASLFSSVDDVRFFGERRVLVDVPNDEIRKDNDKLNINRRVEVRIYLQEFAARIPPSRLGFQAMEQARLAQLNANLNEDAVAKELKLAIFEMIVGLACYAPVIGQAARGYFVAKEGSKVLMSGAQLLDSALFNYYLTSYNELRKNISAIDQLSKETNEILEVLAEIQTHLTEVRFKSSSELIEHLQKNDKPAQELIKRYQRRALALNGLVLLVQKACSGNKKEFSSKWKEFAIDEYINRYIESDGWVLNVELNDNLCNLWLHEVMQRKGQKQIIERYGEEIGAKIIARNSENYLTPRRKDVSGAFNVAFPVQDKLYSRDQRKGLVDFASQFNLEQRKLSERELGFVRLLVAEPHDRSKWITYDEWESERLKARKKVRLSSFHRLKWQIVLRPESLTDMTSSVFGSEISYQRTDGLFNVGGPKFNVMFKPMPLNKFSVDPKGELSSFYEKKSKDSGLLIGCEFEPYFYFGEDVFSGIKPLISEFDLIDYRGHLENLFKGLPTFLLGKTNSKQQVLEEYAKRGGFKNMTYEFTLSGSNYELPLRVDKTPTRNFTSSKQIFVSVDTNHNYKLEGKSGFINNGNTFSEKDLLTLDFVVQSKIHKGPPKAVIDKIKNSEVAINYGGKRQFMEIDSMFTTANELKAFDWTENKPFSIEVLVVGGEHRKDTYALQNLEWQSVPVSLKLSNIHDKEALFGSKTVIGPELSSNLVFVGGLEKSSGKWVLDTTDVLGKQFDETFVEKALSRIDIDDKIEKKAVYIARFEANYKAPNGQEFKGLRPFGYVVSASGQLQETVLKISSLIQRNVEDKKPFKLPDYEVSLRKQYKSVVDLPCFNYSPDPSYKTDKDMYVNWSKLDSEEKKQRLITWIRDPYLATLVEASLLNK